MTPEAKVKTGIRRWLVAHGWYYTQPIGSGYGSSGTPDFLCCRDGRFVAIEAKAPGKRNNTTVLQKRELESIAKANGLAIVVDDVAQLDELEKTLCNT